MKFPVMAKEMQPMTRSLFLTSTEIDPKKLSVVGFDFDYVSCMPCFSIFIVSIGVHFFFVLIAFSILNLDPRVVHERRAPSDLQ